MVQLLVGVNNASAWIQRPKLLWLSDGDAPVQIFKAFNIPNNAHSLSVWQINNPDEETAVVEAIAVGRNDLQTYLYVLFDGDLLSQFNIFLNPEIGATKRANVNHLHRNIVELTARKFANLAGVIYREEVRTKIGPELGDGIRQAIEQQEINKNDLGEKMLADLYGSQA